MLLEGLRPRVWRRPGGVMERESERRGAMRRGGGDWDRDGEREKERRRVGRYESVTAFDLGGGDCEGE